MDRFLTTAGKALKGLGLVFGAIMIITIVCLLFFYEGAAGNRGYILLAGLLYIGLAAAIYYVGGVLVRHGKTETASPKPKETPAAACASRQGEAVPDTNTTRPGSETLSADHSAPVISDPFANYSEAEIQIAAMEKRQWDGHCRVSVISYPDGTKTRMIKEVRRVTGCSLTEAHDQVEHLPFTVLSDAGVDEADDSAKRLEQDGAVLETEPQREKLRLMAEADHLVSRMNKGLGKEKYYVVLKSYPAQNQVYLIKEIRQLKGCGLLEAREITERVPMVILSGVYKEEAQAAKRQLEQYEAVVDVVEQ